jgi:hypothetical protein
MLKKQVNVKMGTIPNPLTFEDLVNGRPYYIYGKQQRNDHGWKIYCIGTYATPPPRRVRTQDGSFNVIQDPDMIVNRHYDWRFLENALNRIVNNQEIDLDSLNGKLSSALVSGRDNNRRTIITGFNEWQCTKISNYLREISGLLDAADDDYTFADGYNYGATLNFLMLFYVIRNNQDHIRNEEVRNMIGRVNMVIEELEAYYATIVNPTPYPEIVQEAIAARGRRGIMESYMDELPPRIVVGNITTILHHG